MKTIFGAILAAGLAVSALSHADATSGKSVPFTVEQGAHMTPAQRKAAYSNWLNLHKNRHKHGKAATGAKAGSAASLTKTGHP